MKILTPLLLISTCFTANFTYAAPASDQKIQQLLEVMNLDKLLQETMQQIRPQLDQQSYQIVKMTVKKEQLTPQEQIVANELSDKLYAQSKSFVSWDKMKPLYLKIYKEVYDADEIQAQIDFYSSPVGRSILNKSPQVAQATMKIVNTQLMSSMETNVNDLQDIQKKLNELKKAANTQ